MTATCPNGHVSAAEDYCDTCGVPIPPGGTAGTGGTAGAAGAASGGALPEGAEAAGSGAPAPDAGSGTVAAAVPATGGAPATREQAPAEAHTCPNCGTDNIEGALFCEACGYDFTTGAMPRGAAGVTIGAQVEAGESPGASAPAPPAFEWVAEVWIDPDWYRTQEAEDPCPSPGLPTIVPLRHRSVLLGRVSTSKNTHPEIELSSDPGVSRRHAQLTTDGTRWFVEDLGSSNGTFVAPASGPLPERAIAVGPKTELSDDDRLYVGAWTRIVVRAATPEEVETYA
jgi:hypothetical protein